MLLSEGKKGDIFTVSSIQTELKIKNRLLDMGMTKDVRVKIMAYYSKNAYIISMRGSRVVLAKDIAEKIHVETIQKKEYLDHEQNLEHCS